MPVNLKDIVKSMTPAQRKLVKQRVACLITEEMTRQQLRRARKLTQARVARKLGVTQDTVSRLEKRSDLLLSTLRDYVKAMGGSLSLVAQFPDQEPILLSGIAETPAQSNRRKPKAKAR